MIKNSNIKEIKLFNAGTKIISTIKDNFSQFIKSDFSARKRFLCKRSILHVINCLAEFGVKLWLLVCASAKKCSLGTIVLYFNSLDSLKGAYSQFIQQISMFQNSLQYLESLDILEHEEKDNSADSVPFNSHFHLIEFKNVSFRYPGCNNFVLQNINLTLERGKTYFIVGFNGSGKTTLIKLLLRLYQPTDGVILIDGEDIQNIDIAQYYSKIGAIFQDFIQYPFDISKNIIVNADRDNSELLSYALKEVGMYDFVQNLPSKEHTLLMRDWSGGNCYEKMNSPIRIGYAQGWEHAFDAGYYVIFYGSIFMAFLVSGIFANEFRWKTDAVYFSAENSRKKGVISKLAAGFFLTTTVYWGLMLFLNLLILSMLGFDGGGLSILAYPMKNWKSIYNLTFQQRSLLALLDGFLIWLLFTAVAMLISAATRSAGLAVTVPAMLILIPSFLDANGITKESSFLMGFFPDKMARAYVGNFPYILGSLLGKVVPMLYIQRILYIFLVVMLTLISWQVFRSKQVS